MNSIDIEFPSAVVGASTTLGHFIDRPAFERFADAYREAAEVLPPADARTVETSYGLVRAYRFGAGTPDTTGRAPIVLLSGRDSATPMWAPAIGDLIGLGRPVYGLDSVGGPGCSAQTSPLDTGDQQASWVAEAVRGLGHEHVHLVGHSMGGWLAVQVAMHRPEVLASVTALDPPRVFTELSPGFVAAGLTASVSAVPARLRRRLIGWIAGAPMSEADPVDRLGWTSVQTFRARQQPPQLPRSADLAAIDVPLLAILAGRSRVHRARKALLGAAAVPAAQVELWPDVGHCLHAEEPARLAARIRELVDATGL